MTRRRRAWRNALVGAQLRNGLATARQRRSHGPATVAPVTGSGSSVTCPRSCCRARSARAACPITTIAPSYPAVRRGRDRRQSRHPVERIRQQHDIGIARHRVEQARVGRDPMRLEGQRAQPAAHHLAHRHRRPALARRASGRRATRRARHRRCPRLARSPARWTVRGDGSAGESWLDNLHLPGHIPRPRNRAFVASTSRNRGHVRAKTAGTARARRHPRRRALPGRKMHRTSPGVSFHL
jgi:hypothetical protein